jgi:hypothetical protein
LAPVQTVWLYCGPVMTDHGALDLPESRMIPTGEGRHEAIVDALRTGCADRLTVAGCGHDLAAGEAMDSHRHKTLARRDALGCP